MSADNQEFSIPFEESRRGANSSPEEKAALGRLGRYLGSRAIDRPTIGDGRRNRRNRRGGRDFDLPTGGKPGTRKPTGSRRDIDGDGWADEGTTKPVWVGVGGQGAGGRTSGRLGGRDNSRSLSSGRNDKKRGRFLPEGGGEQGEPSKALSSGVGYESLVTEIEKNYSSDKSKLARRVSQLLDDEELTRADEWEISIDSFGDEEYIPKPNEPRRILKEKITQGLTELFGGEIELRRDMVVTAANGEKVNLGNKVKVVVYESRVDVDALDAGTAEQVKELQLYDNFDAWKDGEILRQASIWIHITPTDEAAERLIAAGLPDDLTDPLATYGYDKRPVLGRAQRTINAMGGETQIVHDVFFINEQAQGYGIASQFNARNEQIYRDMGILRILTEGSSSGDEWQGATHWPRNGFTWAGEKDKQEFIALVDEAIKNNILSDEERERISPLYRFNEDSGLFETSASPEELIDFEKADSYFQEAEAGFLYKRDIQKSSDAGADSGSLSSGKAPRYPRTPTLGAFLGKADEDFDGIDSWEKFKEIYDGKEIVFFDYETTGLEFDEFGQEISRGVPVQFGAVKIKDGKEVGRINLFMNPNEPLGEWSRNNLKDVDGNPLTDEWLGTQMSVDEAHRQLIEFAGPEAIFGVQNATFDKTVLDEVLDKMGEQWRPSGYLDTREIASLTLPKWTPENEDGPFSLDREGNKRPSSSLAAITQYLGVELGEGHHNADADAFATSQVMKRIIDGAIEKGWSRDALNKEKRDSIHKPSVDKFNSELAQFEKDKSEYMDGLSSGRQRPLIPMRTRPERIAPEPGKREVKGYGQKDSSGVEVRRSSSKWLAGMTSDEMARVLVPSSKEEHFEMWADDLAGPGWRADRKFKKFLREYYEKLDGDKNALRIDYSPEGLEASRELIRSMLDSSPQMKWMFENFGAPLIGVFTRDAMNEYEGRPDVKERMELLRQQRNMKKTPFVSGLASREFGFIGLTPRALIDRESYDDAGAGYPLELDPNRKPQLRDAHVDRSLHGTLIHEYGHWLHYRAVRDLETNGSAGQKTYYGSGKIDDPSYRAALDVAEEYASPDTDEEAIAIYSEFIDLTGRNAEEMFRAHPDKALMATSYGNVNKREAIAEAFVAIMHPNKDLAKTVLSPKLRRDIYTLSGIDPEDLPWERRADGRPRISMSLSSGAESKPDRERRRKRISRALRQLVGVNDEREVGEQKQQERYEFEAPERPEGLVSFSAEPSDALREMLPVPSEDTLREELTNDVKLIPQDPILEEMSKGFKSNAIHGFGVGLFASLEDRKASAAAKRMISLHVSQTANIDPIEFIESFSTEKIEEAGLGDNKALVTTFFGAAKNFSELRTIIDATKNLGPDASSEEKAKAGRFAVNRTNGTIVSAAEHDKIIQRRFYYDEMIDILESKSPETLFGPEWDDLTRLRLGDEQSIFTPYLMTKVAGADITKDLLSRAQQIRTMLNEFADDIRGSGKRIDNNTGREVPEGGFAIVMSPIGDINPRTGEPNMAIVSRLGTVSKESTEMLRQIIRDGKIIPQDEQTAEQRRAHAFLRLDYGYTETTLERIAEAGFFVVDSSNIDSDEVKQIFKRFLVERMRTAAGDAELFKARYEYESGVSFFDINTPEGVREAKAAIVSDIIHTWAISANNSNPVALAIQHEVRKLFNLNEAVGWYGRVRGPREGARIDTAISIDQMSTLGPLEFDDAPQLSEVQGEIVRSIVKAIYDATQHYYKSKGITHVAVWRGMRATPEMVAPRGELVARRTTMRPLSSWTTNSAMAQSFATSLGGWLDAANKKEGLDLIAEQEKYDENLLIKAFVPVEQIFSNPLTGFGCLGEDEVVLLGMPTDTIMITPPATLLPEIDESAPIEHQQFLRDVLNAASERDKQINPAYNALARLGMDEFAAEFKSRQPGKSAPQSPGPQLSSGKVIKYNWIEARMKAADIKVTFNRDPERVAAVKATLQKGFMGGFTVEVDRMDDIKKGVAVARNKHGMKVDAVAEFDAEGNPSDELVDTFLSWMDFHGPKTFMEPKPGAENTTIGGWVSEGTLYLDVVDVYPDTDDNIQKAAEMGMAEDQIAVTNLTKLWEYLGRGEDPSPAFIDSGGTGGFTLDEESVRRVSAALSEINSNKFNTGSLQLKRIGNSKKFTKGPITGARRVRNTDFSTGEKNDYWVVSGANGMVKVFTHEQYIKVRDRKIQGLFDKMSTQSDILSSMFEAKNIKPVASMKFDEGSNVGKPVISSKHKNRGLPLAMAHLYGFANDKDNVRVLVKKDKSQNDKLSSGKKIVNKQTEAHDKSFKEKFNQDVPEGDGDCFSQAITQVRRLEREMMDNPSRGYTNIKVVHGYPLGTGGEAEGLRFPHAWVEFTVNGIEFVRDYSNGNRVEIPKAMYYSIGNIDENDAKKYSYEDAIRSMNESQHYGPW